MMRALTWLPALILFASAATADDLPDPPPVAAGLTIPELVATLEKAGYSNFDAANSDERTIRLQTETPEGRGATVKYLKATGTVVIVREQTGMPGDGSAPSGAGGNDG